MAIARLIVVSTVEGATWRRPAICFVVRPSPTRPSTSASRVDKPPSWGLEPPPGSGPPAGARRDPTQERSQALRHRVRLQLVQDDQALIEVSSSNERLPEQPPEEQVILRAC
ncbi:MAG: hypothetical protein R2711_05295 [Acidimicrobiales bacterium]